MSAGRVSVLCVDDDPNLVALTATQLERADGAFDVTTTTDPRTALERVSESGIDCVVSDYDMPGMDGLELLETLRADHPDLPVILFTGKGSEEVASEAIARGVTDYLQKGSGGDRYELLVNRIENAVEQYRAGRRAASLDRVRGILRDVNRSLIRAADREAIERRVCEIVTAADPYRLACIVAPSGSAGGVDVRVSMTDGQKDSDACRDTELESMCPAEEAIESGEIVTVTTGGEPTESRRERTLEECGYSAAGAIPITYDGREYGALCLFADEAEAFDTEERALLAEVGEDVSHAIYRAELHDRFRRDERIITNLPIGVYRNTPLPDGTLLAVNPALVDLFDAEDAEDLIGRPFRELYADPADREQFTAALRRDGIVRGMELDLETLSGDPFRASVTGIMTDQGDERYFDGIVRDVSERCERERTLEQYEALFGVAPCGGFRTTADGDLRDANRRMAELLGYDSADAAVAAIDDLAGELWSAPERRETFIERLQSADAVCGFEIDLDDRREQRRALSIDAARVERPDDDGFDIVGWARPAAAPRGE